MADKTDNKPVECGFDGTPTVKHLLTAMVVIPMFGLIFLFLSCVYFVVNAVVGLIGFLFCSAVMLAACIIQLKLDKGTITTDGNDVYVHYGFLSRKIPLIEIANVRCEVESQGTRYGGVIYTMFLLIETKDGKSYRYEQELNVDKDYPTNHPVEYRTYLNSQPMRKLSEFIKARV
ncbi:MAG: hypothetical protein IJZ47_08930 [Oscillospiraceae bacterium]|nr:hypothetical protein [Oscillospiraceae bacterium]